MTKNPSRPVPCSIDGCDKPKRARGWCEMHYTRWLRHGDPTLTHGTPVPCSIDGCDKPKVSRGWCNMHYTRWRRHGDPTLTHGTPHGAQAMWIAQAVESQTDECLLWPFNVNPGGYGYTTYKGATRNAHRVVLMLATGQDRAGLEAAHAAGVCHNRLCANPRHLRWATNAENQRDKVIDDTHMRGERSHKAKLTDADVLSIRADNRTQDVIAAEHGISRAAVGHIKRRQNWAWLEDGAA